MKKVSLLLKIVFLFTSVPLLLRMYLVDGTILENGNNFIVLLCSFLITDIYITINLVRAIEYKKYKAVDTERKINTFVFFLLVLSVFYLIFNVFVPMLTFGNIVLQIGIFIFGTIFLFFYIGFVWKIINDYKKNSFNPFKRSEKVYYLELVANDLKKLNTYQKILLFKNNIIVVNEAGIFEFVNFTKKGLLKGDISKEVWYLDNKEINNPFKLKDVNSYLISNNTTVFNVNVKLVPKSNIYSVLEKHLNNKIYDTKQIDNIYNDLEVKYGSNEDKIY